MKICINPKGKLIPSHQQKRKRPWFEVSSKILYGVCYINVEDMGRKSIMRKNRENIKK